MTMPGDSSVDAGGEDRAVDTEPQSPDAVAMALAVPMDPDADPGPVDTDGTPS